MSPCIGFKTNVITHPTTLPAFRYAWLEAPLQARLTRVGEAPDWHDPQSWPTGRLFDTRGEYRWQRRADGMLHVVLLLEAGPLPPPFTTGLALTRMPQRESALILWGEWVNPQGDRQGNPDGGPWFYAPEIPRAQHYPLDLPHQPEQGAMPRLLVWSYRATAGEQGVFTRCVHVFLSPPPQEG